MNIPFFELLEKDTLIKSIFSVANLAELDLATIKHTKEWDHHYEFWDLQIEKLHFKCVRVIKSSSYLHVDLFINNTDFFDNAILYFNTEGILYPQSSNYQDEKDSEEKRKKLGNFSFLNKNVRVSVYKHITYGCRINIGVPQ